MIITTCYRPTDIQRQRCEQAKEALYGTVVERNKQSIATLMQKYGENVLVVSDKELAYYIEGFRHPLFFHPGSTMFRVKRFMKGGFDPFLNATDLQLGMSILDCTLGMGTDAVLAGFVVGAKGQVVGLEKNPLLAYIVQDGLQNFQYDLNPELQMAMRRVQLHIADYMDFLPKLAAQAYDVVYFDPMFQKPIEASNGIEALRQISYYDELIEPIIKEAKRVAKKRVVLKAHYESPLFEKYGFQVLKRKTAQFHYGVIKCP